MLIHASDVSNPTKSWSYYNLWTERVMEEFYSQGDKEKVAGLRVSDGFDRTNRVPQSKFQNGFIAFIVKPLYEVLNHLEFLHLELALASIEDNLNNWKRTTDERRKSVMPVTPHKSPKMPGRRISKLVQGSLNSDKKGVEKGTEMMASKMESFKEEEGGEGGQ